MAEIRLFEKRDTARSVETMAAAFANDALYRYFVEDEGERLAFLKKFMAFRLRYGQKYGSVLVADGGEGVAVLLSPAHKMGPMDLLSCGGLGAMLPLTKTQRGRVMAFNDFADRIALQTADRPCWHLSPICVAPAAQGKGLGTALLSHGLARLKTQPCYLETQSPQNTAFYRACGFVESSCTPVPGTAMTHWGMVWTPCACPSET